MEEGKEGEDEDDGKNEFGFDQDNGECRASENKEIIDNFRGKLWRIICNVDDLKYVVLDEYTVKREIHLKNLEDSRRVPESYKTEAT